MADKNPFLFQDKTLLLRWLYRFFHLPWISFCRFASRQKWVSCSSGTCILQKLFAAEDTKTETDKYERDYKRSLSWPKLTRIRDATWLGFYIIKSLFSFCSRIGCFYDLCTYTAGMLISCHYRVIIAWNTRSKGRSNKNILREWGLNLIFCFTKIIH